MSGTDRVVFWDFDGTLAHRHDLWSGAAWTLIDGATEALARTQGAEYRNVILSNHPPELPLLVDALGLSDFLDRTITSAVVGAEKPNPVIFDYAMAALGIGSTNHVWMVGDNPIADIKVATDVGIRAILADGAYPDSVGTDVLNAAQQIIDAP